ncbi:hypothetical protein ACF06D_01640 [Streptomyces griseoluteus]|uniref:hypothetical protein n=1 Tax=Streptomyces TaxID=1883 RepID=UPI0037003C0A
MGRSCAGCRNGAESCDARPAGTAYPCVTTQYATTQTDYRPSAAARPARWAADTVATMREGARLRLDYSPQSLWRLDRVIGELRHDHPPYEALERVLRGFGAYAGEVIARHTGGEWWATHGTHWLRTPDGRLWDPLEEAHLAFTGEGSLRGLCREATGV